MTGYVDSREKGVLCILALPRTLMQSPIASLYPNQETADWSGGF